MHGNGKIIIMLTNSVNFEINICIAATYLHKNNMRQLTYIYACKQTVCKGS